MRESVPPRAAWTIADEGWRAASGATAERPDELTAANVVSGMNESAGSLIGPLGAGFLLGGFVAGSESVIHYLKHNCRPLIFTASLPPANTAGVLAEAGRTLGFEVEVLPAVTLGGERISSSGVRAALAASVADMPNALTLRGKGA